MPIKEISVEGLEGLLSEVLKIARGLPEQNFLWYRGVNRNNIGLLPGLLRDGQKEEAIFDRERRLLTRFRQRSVAYWPAGYPQNDWEHMFAMQHFGMPTRLLDWSENLFVAAHFALSMVRSGQPFDDNPPVVWCLNPIEWNRSTPLLSEYGSTIQVLTTTDDEADAYRPETRKKRIRSPVAIFGTHNSNRIVAQRGTFMVWGSDPRPLEGFAKDVSANLWKISILGDRQKLSNGLNLLGFGETMVFPELSSLARELSSAEGWR